MKQAYQKSNAITTVSQFSKKELQVQFGMKKRIEAIPLGVDHFVQWSSVHCFDEQREWEHLRYKYGIPDRFVLFVSNLLPHKNCEKVN